MGRREPPKLSEMGDSYLHGLRLLTQPPLPPNPGLHGRRGGLPQWGTCSLSPLRALPGARVPKTFNEIRKLPKQMSACPQLPQGKPPFSWLPCGPQCLLSPNQDPLGTQFSRIAPPIPHLPLPASVLSWEPRATSGVHTLPQGGPGAGATSSGSQMVQETPTHPYSPTPPTGTGLGRTLESPGATGSSCPSLAGALGTRSTSAPSVC